MNIVNSFRSFFGRFEEPLASVSSIMILGAILFTKNIGFLSAVILYLGGVIGFLSHLGKSRDDVTKAFMVWVILSTPLLDYMVDISYKPVLIFLMIFSMAMSILKRRGL